MTKGTTLKVFVIIYNCYFGIKEFNYVFFNPYYNINIFSYISYISSLKDFSRQATILFERPDPMLNNNEMTAKKNNSGHCCQKIVPWACGSSSPCGEFHQPRIHARKDRNCQQGVRIATRPHKECRHIWKAYVVFHWSNYTCQCVTSARKVLCVVMQRNRPLGRLDSRTKKIEDVTLLAQSMETDLTTHWLSSHWISEAQCNNKSAQATQLCSNHTSKTHVFWFIFVTCNVLRLRQVRVVHQTLDFTIHWCISVSLEIIY